MYYPIEIKSLLFIIIIIMNVKPVYFDIISVLRDIREQI
jgi:hypothetical protein